MKKQPIKSRLRMDHIAAVHERFSPITAAVEAGQRPMPLSGNAPISFKVRTGILTKEQRWENFILTEENGVITLRHLKGDFLEPVASFNASSTTAEEIREVAESHFLKERKTRRYWELVGSILKQRIDSRDPPVAERPDDIVEKLLASLPANEQKVLRLCFDLGSKRTWLPTSQEVAEELGISRQRVHQIKASAIRRLREPNIFMHLHDFLQGVTGSGVSLKQSLPG